MGLRNLKPKQNPPFITEVKVFKKCLRKVDSDAKKLFLK